MTGNPGHHDPRNENETRSKRNTKRREREKFRFTDQDRNTAEWFWQSVVSVAGDHKPPNLDAWADEVRQLREDGHKQPRTDEQIRAAVEFSHSDSFWRPLIISPAKLKEHWLKIEAKRKQAPKMDPPLKRFRRNHHAQSA